MLPWNIKDILVPKLDENLAEFIGIHLGDGTLTKNFIRIFGDSRYDSSYFAYVSNLVKNLFGFSPFLRFDRGRDNKKHTMYLELCSKKLCDFLHIHFEMPYGNKMTGNAKIPKRILSNRRLAIACLRGLVDTDGSLSKRGNQMCLVFNSNNEILREQVFTLGKKLKIFNHRYMDEVGTNSWKRIVRYFNTVGSSNISNIIRFSEKYHNEIYLYKKDVLNYYKAYNNTILPFKTGRWSSGYGRFSWD